MPNGDARRTMEPLQAGSDGLFFYLLRVVGSASSIAAADGCEEGLARTMIRRPTGKHEALHQRKIAGDGIRTHDVQLGKNEPLFSDWFSKPLFAAA
jgi:hypothetical protein